MLCHHVGFALIAYAVTQTCNTRGPPSNTAGPAPQALHRHRAWATHRAAGCRDVGRPTLTLTAGTMASCSSASSSSLASRSASPTSSTRARRCRLRTAAQPHRTAPHRTAPHRTAPHRTAPHPPHCTAPTALNLPFPSMAATEWDQGAKLSTHAIQDKIRNIPSMLRAANIRSRITDADPGSQDVSRK